MQVPQNASLLRIYLGEADRAEDGRPLYEDIVIRARKAHLAGATVLRGPLGFGHTSHLHTAKILRLSSDLPIVIEIVDSEDRIRDFLGFLDGSSLSCLVTIAPVTVVRYGAGDDGLATAGA